jgi:WD40 repeat protein
MTPRRHVYSRPGTANPLSMPPPFSSTVRLDTAYPKDNQPPRPSFSGSLRPDLADPRRPSTGIASAVHNAMSRLKDEPRLKRTLGGLGDTVEKVARKIGLSRPIRGDSSPKGLLASSTDKRPSAVLSEDSSVRRPYRTKSKRSLRWRGNSFSSTRTSLATLEQGQAAPASCLRHDSYDTEQERRQRNRRSFCMPASMALPPLPPVPTAYLNDNGQQVASGQAGDRPQPEVRRCNSLAHNMRLGGGASSATAAGRHNSLRSGHGTRPSFSIIQRVPVLQFHQFPASAGASARAAVAEHNRTFFGFSEESIPEQDVAAETRDQAHMTVQLLSSPLTTDLSSAPPMVAEAAGSTKSCGSPYDSAVLDLDSGPEDTLEIDRKARNTSHSSLDSMADSVMDVDVEFDVSFLGKSAVCFPRPVLTNPDPVQSLPVELVEVVFSNLDLNSVISARLVSRSWNAVASSNAVWRSLFRERFVPNQAGRSSYLQIGGLGIGKPGRVPHNWFNMAKARAELDAKWREAQPSAFYFCGHTDSVYCCQFDEEKIITGSRDRTIRVWDLNSFKCIKVIGGPNNKPVLPSPNAPQLANHPNTVLSVESMNGTPEGDGIYHVPQYAHQASILCLQFDHEIMVTGSSDTTCIVWDIKTFEPIHHLRRHTAGVLDICFDERHIVSCSKDYTICVWNRKTFRLLQVLRGHRDPVNAVQIRGNLLVSASGDGMSRLWDLRTLEHVRTFASRDRGLAAVEFSDDGRYVLAGGNDQVIYKYDALTCEVLHVFTGHSNLVRSLFLDCNSRRVLSGSYDQGIRVYNFDNGDEIGVYNNWTTSWILSAKCDYRRIVATSQDGRVLMMDFGYGVENIDRLSGLVAS